MLKRFTGSLREDLPASVVVFLVALPLCLGIALASGVPPLAGVVSGIVGGIVIGLASGSHTSVSGPAAGLIVMVLAALDEFGYEGLLLVTVLAGGMQILFGAFKGGGLQRLFPKAVIQGMLVAIGIILILKQIPYAIGFHGDYEGATDFFQGDGRNTLSEIPFAIGHFHLGSLVVALVAFAILIGAPKIAFIAKRNWLPPALLAVVAGVLLHLLFSSVFPPLAIGPDLLVALPTGGLSEIQRELATPDFAMISQPAIWIAAVGIALVASVETLLCTEAVDGLDTQGRHTDPNRELLAQGLGNAIAGCLGGIPITAVIVRGSANVQAGAKSKMSAVLHGVYLLVAIFALGSVINMIPLAALAALLIVIGFRLASPTKVMSFMRRSPSHWVPFLTTVGVILFTDLLKGIGAGLVVSMLFVVISAARARRKVRAGEEVVLEVGPIVPWLSEKMMARVVDGARSEEGAVVTIDATDSDPINTDIRSNLDRVVEDAKKRGVSVTLEEAKESAA